MKTSNSKTKSASERIVLIGLSASGKSEVGKDLSKKLKFKFIDIDSQIEQKAGQSISQIFLSEGEKHFRKLESECIRDILKKNKNQFVCSLGGGAFQNREIKKMLLSDTVVIYLKTSLEVLYQRLKNKNNRPLLSDNKSKKDMIATLQKLRNKRESNYLKADIVVTTSNKTIRQVSKLIIKKIGVLYANS